jgi:hypothetical protein
VHLIYSAFGTLRLSPPRLAARRALLAGRDGSAAVDGVVETIIVGHILRAR